MLGVTRETLEEELASMRGEDDFFSVASTMPLLAFMPREVTPWLTALRAYSVDGLEECLVSKGVAMDCTYLHQLAAAWLLARVYTK